MKIDKLEVAAALTPGVLLALVGGAVFGAVAATLDPAERAALGAMLAPRGALFFLGWMLAAGALGAWSLRLYAQHVAAPARLAEAVQALSAASVQRELKPQGGAGARALTAAVNELLRQRDAYRDDVQGQVAQAARGISLPARTSNGSPVSARRRFRCALTAGWVLCSRKAAREPLRWVIKVCRTRIR